MAVKQLGNSGTAPDGSMYVTMTDGAGNLSSVGAGSSGTVTTTTNTEGTKTTYSAGTVVTPAGAMQDIFAITGSASKTVRVTRMTIGGQATAATFGNFTLTKRSTANTGGTSAAVTAIPHDSANAAATATVLSYSAAPTLGNTVGALRNAQQLFTAGGTPVATPPTIWDFTTRNTQGIVLRGTSQVLGINFGGSTIAGLAVSVDVEWTEE